jgi:hypothetical protein
MQFSRSCTYKVHAPHPPLFVKVYVELSPLLNFGQQPYSFMHILQVVYHKCVKFHKNPISRLGGAALTRYTTPPFRESIS